jgi:septum formation protein
MLSDAGPAAPPLPLILASRSTGRAAMLRNARVPAEIVPAAVDETAVKAGMLAEGALPRDVADALAELKARRVAAMHPGRLVLGADQVLVCGGRIYDKPRDRAEARAQLASLRGRRHELLSAAVVFENAAPVWRHIGRASLAMRPFSDDFLDAYVEDEGDALLATVGAYRLEDGGAQLFARIDGDVFTIMGLPLLELLAFLRTRGVCRE